MMPAPATDQGSGRAAEEYFIPDLSTPRSTLMVILAAEMLVVVHTLAISQSPMFSLEQFAVTSLFVQWVALLSTWLICRCTHGLSQFSTPLATVACLALVTFATVVSSVFVKLFLSDTLGIGGNQWWLWRNLLIANLLAAIMLRYFYLQQQIVLREQSALRARLDAMRARIRPHFLFNTLNSIASLIESRPDLAERAVEDLGELFRASLKEDQGETSVADEIRLTETYLAIEALRLGQRLSVEWQVEDSVSGLPMPSLVIQPLAENAVYHGIARRPSGGQITFDIGRSEGELRVLVCNPLPPPGAETSGHRIALDNIEQRLRTHYGEGASLRTSSSDGSFNVELRYPLPPET